MESVVCSEDTCRMNVSSLLIMDGLIMKGLRAVEQRGGLAKGGSGVVSLLALRWGKALSSLTLYFATPEP